MFVWTMRMTSGLERREGEGVSGREGRDHKQHRIRYTCINIAHVHLIGVVKTTGRVVWPAASPLSSEITDTMGLAADMVN